MILNGFGDSSHARAEVAALGDPGYHDADLRDVGQIEAMMRYAESTFGGVDIVINAGIQHVAPVEQFPVWTNGTIFSPSILQRLPPPARRCRVCASATGAHHQHCLSAWPGGVEKSPTSPPSTRWSADQTVARNRAQRHHLQRHLPRWVPTPAGAADRQTHRRGVDPQASAQLLAETALREFVTPQQLGEMALFLCSDAAARCAAPHGTWMAAAGSSSRWRREDQNIARKRFTVRERSKRRRAMAISVFSGAPLSG